MEDEATVKLKISNLKSYLKLNGKAMFGEGTTAYCEIEKGFCKIKYSHEEEVPGGPDESTCDLLNIPPPPVCVATGSPNCTPYLNYGSPALHQGHPGYISEIYWHMMASQQGYDFVFQEEAAEYTRQHFVETHAEQAFVVGVEISSMRRCQIQIERESQASSSKTIHLARFCIYLFACKERRCQMWI